MSQASTSAGIILCGGKSERMGRAKPLLPFGNEVLLQRVARNLSQAVNPLIIVAAPGQSLPKLSYEATIVYDRQPGCGPLEGLAMGLKALPKTIDCAFVTGCDTPFISPAFIQRIVALLDEYAVAIPKANGRYHPLCAAFSKKVLPDIEKMLDRGERRMGLLIELITNRDVLPDEWIDIDPQSKCLCNLNNPEDYALALKEADMQ